MGWSRRIGISVEKMTEKAARKRTIQRKSLAWERVVLDVVRGVVAEAKVGLQCVQNGPDGFRVRSTGGFVERKSDCAIRAMHPSQN